MLNLHTQNHTGLSMFYTLQVVYGQASARARWRDCESYVTGQMGMAVGHVFVRETFDESAKSIVRTAMGI